MTGLVVWVYFLVQITVIAVTLLTVLVAVSCTNMVKPAPAAGTAASFGNDHFGHWLTDAYGLPAFAYTADEVMDRAARWNDGQAASTSFWHQVGNDRVVAAT